MGKNWVDVRGGGRRRREEGRSANLCDGRNGGRGRSPSPSSKRGRRGERRAIMFAHNFGYCRLGRRKKNKSRFFRKPFFSCLHTRQKSEILSFKMRKCSQSGFFKSEKTKKEILQVFIFLLTEDVSRLPPPLFCAPLFSHHRYRLTHPVFCPPPLLLLFYPFLRGGGGAGGRKKQKRDLPTNNHGNNFEECNSYQSILLLYFFLLSNKYICWFPLRTYIRRYKRCRAEGRRELVVAAFNCGLSG